MGAPLANRRQPVQPTRWRVIRAVHASLSNLRQPVQLPLPRASRAMDAANRLRSAVDNKGMEPHDGFHATEGQRR